MVELGKIQKPEAESFADKKKLYCIRNIYLPEDIPEDYGKLFHSYWDEVVQQLEKIEVSEKITKIFCENISTSGKEALDLFGRTNSRAMQIIKNRLEKGGILFPLEQEDILGPFMDWSTCLMLVRSKEVLEKVYGFYTESLNRRFKHILDVIEKNLSKGEAGLLLMRDEDRVRIQFPNEVEIFLVTPPSYDNILKWLREKVRDKGEKKEPAEAESKE
jgi:hypothetical protein